MRVPQSTYDAFAGMWPVRVRCQDCPTELVEVNTQEECEAWLDAHALEFHSDDDEFTFELQAGTAPEPDPDIPEEE